MSSCHTRLRSELGLDTGGMHCGVPSARSSSRHVAAEPYERRRGGIERGALPTHEHNVGTRLREPEGDLLTQTPTAAGDHRPPPCQRERIQDRGHRRASLTDNCRSADRVFAGRSAETPRSRARRPYETSRLIPEPKRNEVVLGGIWLEHRDRGLLRGRRWGSGRRPLRSDRLEGRARRTRGRLEGSARRSPERWLATPSARGDGQSSPRLCPRTRDLWAVVGTPTRNRQEAAGARIRCAAACGARRRARPRPGSCARRSGRPPRARGAPRLESPAPPGEHRRRSRHPRSP
jgi:hypothetical protein